MHRKLFLQLHVHSERSHDSSTSISDYVSYLHNLPFDFDCAILGVTDHNIVPISMERALEYSTPRVMVIPGIQWRLRQSISDRLLRGLTRREIITIGDHDDFRQFVTRTKRYSVSTHDEVLGHWKEDDLLDYLENRTNLALIVPHPRHFLIDYYGAKEISHLKNRMMANNITIPFFVEVKTGYDPFPRIFSSFEHQYCVLGGSDAHGIKGPFGIESMLSVESTIDVENGLFESWANALEQQDLPSYVRSVRELLYSLRTDNKRIEIRKSYIRSLLQLIGLVPRWFRRRFQDFPRNLIK